MAGNFLSIDWDYFIEVHSKRNSSYRETQRDILAKWYNEFFISQERGGNIKEEYDLGENYNSFLESVVPQLHLAEGLPFVLTESHARAYNEVIAGGYDRVYLLDAHSDLGYGGIEALDYEVNCANWLGMLLKSGKVKEVFIIYSPYTKEDKSEFKEITAKYPVKFISLQSFLGKAPVFDEIHLCRSGPWTPPWYDLELYKLADRIRSSFKLSFQDEIRGPRNWEPEKTTLAERINYMLGILR